MKCFKYLAGLALTLFCLAFTTAPAKKVIVIDAGHGGDDHGATHNELTEKRLVLSIASKIKMYAANHESVEIVLLRNDDHFMDLNERIQKINDIHPDLLISLHINYSHNRKENGASAYVSKNNSYYASSHEKANGLLDAIASKRLAKKEIKNANLQVLNNVTCPGIMLELGYLTNDMDRIYISSENGQTEIARTIATYCLQQ